MSITAFENLISTAERRILINGEEITCIRMADFLGIYSCDQWKSRIGL